MSCAKNAIVLRAVQDKLSENPGQEFQLKDLIKSKPFNIINYRALTKLIQQKASTPFSSSSRLVMTKVSGRAQKRNGVMHLPLLQESLPVSSYGQTVRMSPMQVRVARQYIGKIDIPDVPERYVIYGKEFILSAIRAGNVPEMSFLLPDKGLGEVVSQIISSAEAIDGPHPDLVRLVEHRLAPSNEDFEEKKVAPITSDDASEITTPAPTLDASPSVSNSPPANKIPYSSPILQNIILGIFSKLGVKPKVVIKDEKNIVVMIRDFKIKTEYMGDGTTAHELHSHDRLIAGINSDDLEDAYRQMTNEIGSIVSARLRKTEKDAHAEYQQALNLIQSDALDWKDILGADRMKAP